MVACRKDTGAKLKRVLLAETGTPWAPKYLFEVMNYKSLKNKMELMVSHW